jgi:hypothetical protein
VIGVEGELTGDGRLIETDALRWENLPLPLRYVSSDMGAHDGAVVVGRINSLSRSDTGQILGEGDFDLSSPAGVEAARQVGEGLTSGISMDLDDVNFEVRVASELVDGGELGFLALADGNPDTVAAPPEVDADGRVKVMEMKADDEVQVTTSGRIRAATIVAIPAFASAKIQLVGSQDALAAATPPPPPVEDDEEEPEAPTPEDAEDAAPEDASAEFDAGVADLQAVQDLEFASPEYMERSQSALDHFQAAVDGLPPDDPAVPEIQVLIDKLTAFLAVNWGDPETAVTSDVVSEVPEDELVASAGVTTLRRPPASWFRDPKLSAATPLTVTENGRVYGHLALWGTCHTGHAHQCIQPPPSVSGYGYFHTGSLLAADGTEVAVGHITMDTRHAKTTDAVSAAAALAHYEHTGKTVADVAAGEDGYGIWVSGALRPSVTEEQKRALRASPLSGDWRRIGTSLELIAALAVNVPGFPIPRPSGLVAGGAMQSLVASGMLPPRKVRRPGTEGALSTDDLRYLKRLAATARDQESNALRHRVNEARVRAFAARRRLTAVAATTTRI